MLIGSQETEVCIRVLAVRPQEVGKPQHMGASSNYMYFKSSAGVLLESR